MRSWGEIFGVDREPVVGSPEVFRLAGREVDEYGDRVQSVLDAVRSATRPSTGFEGAAADALAAFTEETVEQLRGVPDTLSSIGDGLRRHADDLEGLIDVERAELFTANERYNEVRRLEVEVDLLRLEHSAATEDVGGVGLALNSAERRRRNAEDSLFRSRRVYDALRSDEEELHARTARLVADHPLATYESGLRSVDGVVMSIGQAELVDSVWAEMHGAMVGSGFGVGLPTSGVFVPQEYGEGCQWVDASGRINFWLPGPGGGAELVVGHDISPGVYSAVQSLLSGWIPGVRSWSSMDELSASELGALNWAFGTHFGPLESGALYVSGTNGVWQNFLEGGDYRPQRITSMDGLRVIGPFEPGALPATALAGVVLVDVLKPAGKPKCDGHQPTSVPNRVAD